MRPLTSTARMTGLFYLGLGITGILGFLLIRPQLFDADDPNATLANVIENEALARAGVALELGIVLTQALVAIWFYRLFRSANPVGAAAIAAFGLVNAGAILGSTAALATAVQVATEPIGDTATTVQLLYMISANLWGAGALFFGLWMIPMGACVIGTRWMPRPLGWLLVAGGVGYVLSAFIGFVTPDMTWLVVALTIPASVGEFWMIGYLLIIGVRRSAPNETPLPLPAAAPTAA